MSHNETEPLRCLHCGQTKAEIKRDQTICGTVSGYEYQELDHEWPHHRWADWKDHDLPMVLPAFRHLYRRTPATHLEWLPCEHTPAGHIPATEDTLDWVDRLGQCIACGQDVTPLEDQERADEFERTDHG
jgi:hypothetical protein